ncbi:15665_t:CDS:2 [Gigaspora margarita]|uniref:15665_t:CDS:1 n=1 Tax=Gigaspora margarita TaxID=4874 RepID=A0ABN7UH52_GIGMA|nr:15665_t:CDS:2 [Gigaspora margarita]
MTLFPKIQNYQEAISQAQTSEHVEQIEKKVINDGNTKKAEKTVKNLLEKAKKG